MGIFGSSKGKGSSSQDKGKKSGKTQKKGKKQVEETELEVYIAMFKDGPYYKHWALYVERPFPDEEESFICHVTGSAGNFQYEDKNNHARTSNRIYKLYFLGHISESDLDNLRNVCRSLLVNNGDATWNCQNFVWDAFGALVEAGILRPAQGVDKRTIWNQMDGV